jgi:proteasome lid subunit RPN8/RPN11
MESAHIPRKLINLILEQSQQSPTKEICGLISSRNKHPTNCYPVTNTAAEPDHRYLMDPRQQIDTLRTMRNRGEELYAIYHSHPETSASPSSEDLRQASYPDALHIIISTATTGTLQLRGFRFNADSATAIDITVD